MITRAELEDFLYDLLHVNQKIRQMDKRYKDLLDYNEDNGIDCPAIEVDSIVIDKCVTDFESILSRVEFILEDKRKAYD